MTESQLPLGTRVVEECISVCTTTNHLIFFDNFFSSYGLIHCLGEKGYRATGTIRNNRLNGRPLTAVDKMKKKERGSYYELRLSGGMITM